MRLIAIALVLAALPAPLVAQTVAPATGPGIEIGVEARRDRLLYHFDNPSSADTSFLVPHFFEQSYVTDNLWLVAAVRYVAAVPWETSVAVTLPGASAGATAGTGRSPHRPHARARTRG